MINICSTYGFNLISICCFPIEKMEIKMSFHKKLDSARFLIGGETKWDGIWCEVRLLWVHPSGYSFSLFQRLYQENLAFKGRVRIQCFTRYCTLSRTNSLCRKRYQHMLRYKCMSINRQWTRSHPPTFYGVAYEEQRGKQSDQVFKDIILLTAYLCPCICMSACVAIFYFSESSACNGGSMPRPMNPV